MNWGSRLERLRGNAPVSSPSTEVRHLEFPGVGQDVCSRGHATKPKGLWFRTPHSGGVYECIGLIRLHVTARATAAFVCSSRAEKVRTW